MIEELIFSNLQTKGQRWIRGIKALSSEDYLVSKGDDVLGKHLVKHLSNRSYSEY